ncbi:hypothetical protein LOTGIDRAFT_122838, partial [Lottia gigantea]
GAIFDRNSGQVHTAFRHEVQSFNRAYSGAHRYRLENITKELDVTDSFAVSNALCSHLSKGVLAIFGVSNASSLATIQSYSNTFKVPFITISMAQNTSSKDSYQIYMRPLYIHAIIKVLEHFDWRKVSYIYDSDEGLIRLQQLFQSTNLYEYDLHIGAKRITTVDNCFNVLYELHKKDEEEDQRIILDLQIEKAEEVIKQIMRYSDVSNARFHFLLGELGMLEMNLTNFETGGINITGFQLMDPKNQTVEMFLNSWANLDPLEWPGAGTKKIKYEAALAVDAVRLFTRSFSGILGMEPNFLHRQSSLNENKGIKCTDDSLVTSRQGDKIIKQMKSVNFDGVTGRVAFDENGHRKDFTLGVYDVAMNRGIAKIGSWNNNDGFQVQQPRLWRDRNANALDQNRTRIITTIQVKPYVMFKSRPKDGTPLVSNDMLEGFCIDLTEAVAREVGFNYRIKFVHDSKYGAKNENNLTWNGMVGELINHEADIAIAPLTITANRERVIDFTKPFMSLGISIMIKKPENQKAHVFSFMDPLSYEIWMCIVFAYIGVSVVLFLVSRFSPNEWHLSEDSSITNDFTISNSLWFSLGAFMQQGCDVSPRSMSGRIVGSVWWFFTLIIISSYTANLAAFLTVERMLTPIESAEDLAKQTDIQYGTTRSGSTEAFFKQSKVDRYHRMWSYMTSATPSVFVDTIEEGIRKVREANGKYAFLIESTTNEYVNKREPCDTMKVGNNLNSNGFGIATPVGSDLKDKLNFAVLELRESGQLASWQKKWWLDTGTCPPQTTSKDGAQSALSLNNVAGIFFILIGGLVLALITAGLEFLYKSKKDARRYKTTFGSAVRSKARLSFRGHSDGPEPTTTRLRKSMSTYTYTGPSQVVGVDACNETNTHTQV